MTRSLEVVFLLAMTCGTAFAQSADSGVEADVDAQTGAVPVATIYVSNLVNGSYTGPHNVYAYTVAANGKLTKVTGAPFADNVGSLAVNGKYLFGLGGSTIDSYTINPNGTVHLTSSFNAYSVETNPCGGIGPLRMDHSGGVLYNAIAPSDCESFAFQAYGVNGTNGKLTWRGDSDEVFAGGSELDFLGNNQFAYSPVCTNFDHEEVGYIAGFKRETTGKLSSVSLNNPGPTPKDTSNSYCPYTLATDPTNHMAALMEEEDFDSTPYGTPVITSYSVAANGQLSTTNTYKNMPHTRAGANNMRMSPSGKLLAVGGTNTLQVFHFNGANPASLFKTVMTSGSFYGLYWDNSNHLFALEWTAKGNGKLYVFTVTTAGVTQAPGSPYAIPNPDSITVHMN